MSVAEDPLLLLTCLYACLIMPRQTGLHGALTTGLAVSLAVG